MMRLWNSFGFEVQYKQSLIEEDNSMERNEKIQLSILVDHQQKK